MTTATGAVSQICEDVAAGGAAKVAVKGQEAALTTACATIKPVLDARKTRIADTTNVEIIASKGSDCDASSSATPFGGYVPAAYDAVAKLYALAALEAGQFPEITTHYFLDSTTPPGSPGPVTKSQNRCDPRCFDLDRLYAKIAAILNHPAGTTYGRPADLRHEVRDLDCLVAYQRLWFDTRYTSCWIITAREKEVLARRERELIGGIKAQAYPRGRR